MITSRDVAAAQFGNGRNPSAEKTQTWILAATIIGSSMAFIDGTVVNVALPALQNSFHATLVDVQWVVESYGLLLAALILVGGSLGDLFGRRRVFVLGVIIFAAASLGCGLASDIHQLILTRSIQGIGAALLVPGSLTIISSSFDEKNRGQAIGTWSGFTAITTALGPVLGGWLVEHASWRWVFFINLPLAAAVVAIALWRVPESRGASGSRVDWLGGLIVTLGLGGVVFGLIESANFGWRSPVVLASLIGGCACLILFLRVEARETSPMIPLTLFASSTFSGANLLTLTLYAAIGIFFFLFPMNLIQVQGYSATGAGVAVLPLILLIFFLSRWSGGLVAHCGPRLPLIIGPLVVSVGFLLFALPSIGGSYWRTLFPATIVLGFGMAITVAPLTTVVMNSVEQNRVGAASGINNAVARVAGVLAIAVLGIVMVNVFGSRLDRSLAHLPLPPSTMESILSNKIKLATMPIPADLPAEKRAVIEQAIQKAFVFGFRVVMLACAGLSIASSAVARMTIPRKPLDLS